MRAVDFDREELIVSLITEDLRNSRFIHRLNSIGLFTENEYSDLATISLKLLGFSEAEMDEFLYEIYFQFIDRIAERNEWDDKLEPLARRLYFILEGWKGNEG